MQTKATLRFSLTSVRMATIKENKQRMLARIWREKGPCTQLRGRRISAATVEISVGVSQETKGRITVWSCFSPPGMYHTTEAPAHPCLSQLFTTASPGAHQRMNGQRKCSVCTQWSITQPRRRMKWCRCRKMNGTGDHDVKQNKPDWTKQI
jgi:hypothetical protein